MTELPQLERLIFKSSPKASEIVPLQRHLPAEVLDNLSLKAPWPFSLFHPSQVNFSDDSDLEDPVSVEARLAEAPKRQGTASRGRGRARKDPSLKTVAVAASNSAPRYPGLGGRSRRAKKVTSGYCEELGSEVMRTIPEEEMTDDQMEMSFEILRGSDGEDSASGKMVMVGGRRCIHLVGGGGRGLP